MLILTQKLQPNPELSVQFTLSLTAEERTRSRYRFQLDDGESVYLQLPRGTILQNGDILQAEGNGTLVRVVAKQEPVLTITSNNILDLLRGAYHLGNRHIPVEITPHYLRLSPDPVLKTMLEQLKFHVLEEIAPFSPETGAYKSHLHNE
jgi:urease accessory protein